MFSEPENTTFFAVEQVGTESDSLEPADAAEAIGVTREGSAPRKERNSSPTFDGQTVNPSLGECDGK